MTHRTARLMIGAIMAGAAALCTIGLGRPALWIDETHSYVFSALPSAPLVVLNAAVRDAYPPLYFLFLHAWMAVSQTETWLRLSSVLFHVAGLPFIFMIGARLVSLEAGVAAAALLAVNPFHLGFATEVRMYAPVEFLSLVSMWGLVEWIVAGSRAGWKTFVAAGVALLYVHFMGALLLIAQAAILMTVDRARLWRGSRRWAVIVVACFLPWAPLFLKAAIVTRGYGSDLPTGRLMYFFLSTLGAGFWNAHWVGTLAALSVALAAAAGALALPAGRARRILIGWALVPVAVELAVNLAGKPVFGERTLISATPAWLLLIACLIAVGPRIQAAFGAVLVGGLAGLGYAHLLLFSLPTGPAHGQALQDVVARWRPGDVIVHSSTITYHPVHEYYLVRPGHPAVEDFLLDPQAAFAGGTLGNRIRDVWRRVRPWVDPAGAIRSGADPNRVGEREFLGRKFSRIWYFHSTEAGVARLWYLLPSMQHLAATGPIRDVAFEAHPGVARAYRRDGGALRYPGLVVECYRRR